MYPSQTQSFVFGEPNAQPGPSTFRSFSPRHPAPSPNPALGYLPTNFHPGSHEGSVQGDSSNTPEWHQPDRTTEASSSRHLDHQMSWSTQAQGYTDDQWHSPYSVSPAGAGPNHDRMGDKGGMYAAGWDVGVGAAAGRQGMLDDRRAGGSGHVDLGAEDDGKREVLLLNHALTELITLLIPFRPTPSGSAPNPPAVLLPRIAQLAAAVHTLLQHLSPRFRLQNPSGSGAPSPRRSVLGNGGRSRSSTGRVDGRQMSSPEREMEAIRRRRDALIQRAKEGPRGGAIERVASRGEGDKAERAESVKREEAADHGPTFNWPETTPHVPPHSSYIPQPDYTSIQQQHLQNLGSHIGMGNYANHSNFPSAPPFGGDGSRSMSFSDDLIFGPAPDTIDNIHSRFNPSSSMLTLELDPTVHHPISDPLFGPDHFSMPPPPPPPAMPHFDYGPRPELNGSLTEDGGGAGRQPRSRCHGCGVVVEGKWMRGPDGPSSLCLSCGAHYAKLNKRRSNEIVNPAGGIEAWGAPPVIAGHSL